MFKHLIRFSYKRNWKEALGFYFAYLLLGMLLGGLMAVLLLTIFGSETKSFEEGFNEGIRVGTITGIVYTLTISVLVLLKRNLQYSFGFVLLVPVAGLIAAFGGSVLALVIPAIMTTRGEPSTGGTLIDEDDTNQQAKNTGTEGEHGLIQSPEPDTRS